MQISRLALTYLDSCYLAGSSYVNEKKWKATGVNGAMQFNQFVIAPYIGDGSPVTPSFWIDNLTVGTARPWQLSAISSRSAESES